MKLIGRAIIHNFTTEHPDALSQANALQFEIENAEWSNPHDLKQRYPKVSLLGNGNVIFDICGNKYRLWAVISYKNGIVFMQNAGTHDEYNKWNIK